METKKVKWENELQALNNIVTNLNLTGCTVHVNHNGGRKKETYFLRDSEGGTLTGSWTYDRLNHFIMGYGKAISHLSENPQTETKVEDVQVGGFTGGEWVTANKIGCGSSLRIYSTDKVQRTHIADCFSFSVGISDEQAEANARLIANAPAMYSALKDILNLDLNMGELLSDIDCPQVNKAKAIINQIDKQ